MALQNMTRGILTDLCQVHSNRKIAKIGIKVMKAILIDKLLSNILKRIVLTKNHSSKLVKNHRKPDKIKSKILTNIRDRKNTQNNSQQAIKKISVKKLNNGRC